MIFDLKHKMAKRSAKYLKDLIYRYHHNSKMVKGLKDEITRRLVGATVQDAIKTLEQVTRVIHCAAGSAEEERKAAEAKIEGSYTGKTTFEKYMARMMEAQLKIMTQAFANMGTSQNLNRNGQQPYQSILEGFFWEAFQERLNSEGYAHKSLLIRGAHL